MQEHNADSLEEEYSSTQESQLQNRMDKDLEKIKNPIGQRVWFNLRTNRHVKTGFVFSTRTHFKQMCKIIGDHEFGEGVITETDESQWTIRVIAPQRVDTAGKQITITMNKHINQAIPPGITWY